MSCIAVCFSMFLKMGTHLFRSVKSTECKIYPGDLRLCALLIMSMNQLHEKVIGYISFISQIAAATRKQDTNLVILLLVGVFFMQVRFLYCLLLPVYRTFRVVLLRCLCHRLFLRHRHHPGSPRGSNHMHLRRHLLFRHFRRCRL